MHRFLALLAALMFATGVAAQDDDEEPSIEMDAEPEGGDEPSGETRRPKTAAPKRKPGQKVGKVKHADKAGRFSVQLPADWVVQPEEMDEAVLAYVLLLPGSKGRASLSADVVKDLGDPRGGPYYWRDGALKNFKASRHELAFDGLPQLAVFWSRDGTEYVTAWAFRRVRGNGLVLRLECAAADFVEARRDFVDAALSLAGELEPWPPVPKRYKTVKKGRFLFAMHPSVTTSPKTMVKIATTQEKRFAKFHGALPKPDRPHVIFVHNDKIEAKPILAAVAESKSDWYVDQNHQRLFCKPVKSANSDEAGLFASDVHALLFLVKYGLPRPYWMYIGERVVARAEHHTGKALPYLDEGFAAWRSETQFGPLAALSQLARDDWKSFSNQALFYVAAFRAGKHKKAYKKFLKAYARNPDWETLYERHIGALDAGKLAADAQKFMWGKIKEQKRER